VCPYQNEAARRFWLKACNYHRGSDRNHDCGNPAACQRRLDEAKLAEGWHLQFVRRWQ